MTDEALFVVRTRYSLFSPGSTDWIASSRKFPDQTAYRDWLWSSERMQKRSDVFIRMSLPLIAVAAEKFRIRHVVSYSSGLPAEYEQQLQQAAERYSFVRLDRRDPEAPGEGDVVARCVDEMSAGGNQVFGLVRLDDDDLLAAEFWSTMARYLTHQHVGWMVSAGSGLYGIYRAGEVWHLRRRHHPMGSVGLMAICGKLSDGTVVRPVAISHTKSDRANPVILDSKSPVWVRLLDGHNDAQLESASSDPLAEELLVERLASGDLPEDEDLEQFTKVLGPVLHASPAPDPDHDYLVKGEMSIGDALITVDVPERPSGKIRISLRTYGPVSKKSMLLGIILVNGEGRTLDKDEMASLKIEGMGLSADREIGWFKYLVQGRGWTRHVIDVQLPAGTSVQALTIRRWDSQNKERARKVGAVLAYSSNPDLALPTTLTV